MQVLLNNQISFEKLFWWRFSSFVLSLNKTFSKSYIIPPLELTLDHIVLNYYLVDTTEFIYAEDNFIIITCLRFKRFTVPNITAQMNKWREKSINIHCEEKTL